MLVKGFMSELDQSPTLGIADVEEFRSSVQTRFWEAGSPPREESWC